MMPRTLATLAALSLAAAGSHAADPVVFNQPNSPANFYTTWASEITPSGPLAIGYDNFTLGAATSISAVQWGGNYLNTGNPQANPIAPNTTSFTVAFFADSGGQPGAQLVTATLAQADCTPTLLGTVKFDTYQIPLYSYRAALPTPFTAAAGQPYWVSIVAKTTDQNLWGWYSSGQGDSLSYQDYQGRQRRNMDRAFALEGGAPAAPATPTVTVAATVAKANANAGTPGVFTLTLPAPAAAKVKVKYTLAGTAVDGTDYAALSGKAVFKPGQSSVDVRVVPTAPPVGVPFDAFKKTVLLTLQPGAGYTVGTSAPAKVKIVRTAGIILP